MIANAELGSSECLVGLVFKSTVLWTLDKYGKLLRCYFFCILRHKKLIILLIACAQHTDINKVNANNISNNIIFVILLSSVCFYFRYQDKTSLAEAIENLQYEDGPNVVADELRLVRSEVFSKSGDRPDFQNVVILITDGLPAVIGKDLSDELEKVKAGNIKIFAVGISDGVDEKSLEEISSSPQQVDQLFDLISYNSFINSVMRHIT